ncbi:ABC transporter permease [Lentilactobacillus parafarraginis]|uniref:ABC transporter permease n=1 Tax=Lentilactobacillus parafarraginis TaxID=390842 RepID=UPI0006D280C3|nr:ABC transporter permease [Lentilactobacillus parafarraginis]
MKRSLQREFYKFYHQRVPLYGAVILLVLMLYTTVSQSGISENVIVHGFGAGQWITIIMVAIASSFVAMEYQNRTIMTLFYKSNNQATIFFAKFLVISSMADY